MTPATAAISMTQATATKIGTMSSSSTPATESNLCLESILQCAVNSATEAGHLALEMQQTLSAVREKKAKDLVTEADLACEDLIKQRIRECFPDHRIVAEETGTSQPDGALTWYVDPIDGTINYSRQIPFWAVSIGVFDGMTPLVGVVFAPALNELFCATAESEPTCNGVGIRVSTVSVMSQAIMSNGDFNIGNSEAERRELNDFAAATRRRAAEDMQRVKCLGSAAVELAYVASGRLDAYLIQRFCAWDVAAGLVLVDRAGGLATRMDGRSFSFDANSVLISNGLIHNDLVNLFSD
jgi:fructose-1,6-bisphosphatase/inositol monophosphatase family enzyme